MTGNSTQLPSASSRVRSLVSVRVPRLSSKPSSPKVSSFRAGSRAMLSSAAMVLVGVTRSPPGAIELAQTARRQGALAAVHDAPHEIAEELKLGAVDVAEKLVIDRLRLGSEGGHHASTHGSQPHQHAATVAQARPLLDTTAP